MDIKTTKTETNWTVLSPTGRIDANTSPEFETFCRGQLDAGINHLAVDLSNVQYMSSAGLRVLLSVLKEISKRGGKMALVAPQENVREVLEISGFAKIFTIIAKVEELTA